MDARNRVVDNRDLVGGATVNELLDSTNPDAIVTEAPEEPFRLGLFSSACLIINRMVGTGIFNSPTTVIRGTKSTGGALLLWFFGILYGLSGAHVYIEYGLNVPRFVIDGVEQAVPRSGADLHYIQYVYRWLSYKKDTVLLSGCLYGISFICLGNMASNCLAFAARVLEAAHPGVDPDKGQVRGIALAAAAFACVIHSVSRRGGIWLSNFLACVKLGILLLIIVMTIVVVAGGVKDAEGVAVKSVFLDNTYYWKAFQPPEDPTPGGEVKGGTVNGYAAAFLSIIFSYNGFDQANYVLGEISRPRRTFPRATGFAVGLVSFLYMVVNICYMAVVPAFEQLSAPSVALLFLRKTFPATDPSNPTPDRIFNSLLALSSFGNIIVMTYTAARMKQEIAKQGFLPFARFFGSNTDISIGRLVLWLRKKKVVSWDWFSAHNHQEPTPVGALVLHLASCVVLIFATYHATVEGSYDLLAKLMAYLLAAWFGMFLAAGILLLRVFGPPDTRSAATAPGEASGDGGMVAPVVVRRSWSEMTGRSVKGWLSVLCAVVYLIGNLFPVVASWIPGTSSFGQLGKIEWWVMPTVSWVVLGFAGAWWLGFLAVAKYRENRQQKDFVYEIRPRFVSAEPGGEDGGEDSSGGEKSKGGKILFHETVVLAWVGREITADLHAAAGFNAQPEEGGRMAQRQTAMTPAMQDTNPLAGTDFDGFGPVMQSRF
ncbi:amino acid permease-domain-containing protein [Staphylotrichum tortipilum]|uniref:Amino acid permease-domain-containing protein n=1 Tax=Staphylotrichum tortipilum TaxID=2831512 RepID=A0AAN6RRQ8_9PEZI|nr:amino acid permease-domain-containing protein [Staphylotrichum longicolle]